MRLLIGYVFMAIVFAPMVLLGMSAHAAGAVEPEVLRVVPDWLQIASIVIAAASSIAAMLPVPKAQGVLSVLRKIIDLFALNVGGAKNAGSTKNTNDLS